MYAVMQNADEVRCMVETDWLDRVYNSFAQRQKARRINQFIWSIDFVLHWILILGFFGLESLHCKKGETDA